MNVMELSQRSGVSAHRLRHYETLGLIRARRTAAGWREFSEAALREVNFIARSREVGVSLKDIAETLPLYRAGTLTTDRMVELMRERVAEVDAQIAAQRALRKKLLAAIAWFEKRQRQSDRRSRAVTSSPWNARQRPER